MIPSRKVLSMRSLLARSLPISALLIAACAPPPAPAQPPPVVVVAKPPPVITPPAPAPTPLDPTIVSVTAARVPAHFALDGDIAEWGSLLPPPPSDPPPELPLLPGETEPGPPAPNPRDAESHAAIALTSDGAVIAADLHGASREGIWLGIGGGAPSVPPIGDWQRGGGVRDFNCEMNLGTGEANPPEAIAACHALLQRHAAFVAAHHARFERVYRVDREGVRLVKPDGTLAAIEGAKALFLATPTGATVEVALPAKALPRMSEAPLTGLGAVARAAPTVQPPALPAALWVGLDLPAPVSFEPWAELRDRVFEEMRTRVSIGPTGLSYQPGDPLHVESISYDKGLYDTSRVSRSEETLYTKKASLGDVEVGVASAYGEWIAILEKGKLVDLVDLPGQLKGVVGRDGEIHILSHSHYTETDIWADSARWSAIAVGPTGSSRGEIVAQEIASFNWNDVEEFHAKDLASFGLRGWTTYLSNGKEQGVEVTWRWDRAKKSYVGKRKLIPVHKKPKKP
jgi:hypothetical protein